jgi:hypothetical protein
MNFCTKPGIDGPVEVLPLPGDGCCPPSICNIDPCAFACQFLNLLPSGPLWDDAKREGIARVTETPCSGICPPSHCSTLIDHAIYTANKLVSFARMFLLPVQENSSPFTAVDGLDFWLSSLGWDDCTECQGGTTIGAVLDAAPTALTLAVKRGIAFALARAQLAPIMNLAAINFIIQELGVYLQNTASNDPWASLSGVQEPTAANLVAGDQIDCGCVAEGCADQVGGQNCVIRPRLNFALRLHSRTLVAAKSAQCGASNCATYPAVTPCSTCAQCDLIAASFDMSGTTVWPGAMAALCILQRLLPAQANINLVTSIP